MAFAVAAFRDAKASRELLDKQLDRTSDARDAAVEKFHEEAKKAAVLEAKLESGGRLNRFQTWAFGIGGVVAGSGFGAAVQAGRSTWLYALLVAAGAVVMWIGSPTSGKES